MKLSLKICVGLMLLPTACLWSQVDNAPTQPATANAPDNNDSRMLTPPPVSGQSYPTSFGASERSNYPARRTCVYPGIHRQRGGFGHGPPGERCELFRSALHRARRDYFAVALGFELRARIHFLSAAEFKERNGPECVHRSAVSAEPARDFQRQEMAFRKRPMYLTNRTWPEPQRFPEERKSRIFR